MTKKTITEVKQWFKHGDHPLVRPYRPLDYNFTCPDCGLIYAAHGYVTGRIVCPGDWIITELSGNYYSVENHPTLEALYEEVTSLRKKLEAPKPCPFCSVPPEKILAHSPISLAFYDNYPISDGHCLVVPRAHVMSLFELSIEDQLDLWAMVWQIRKELESTWKPDGFTVGVNDGMAAGQTVHHAHIHIIPRYKGDVPDPRGGIRHVIPQKAKYW